MCHKTYHRCKLRLAPTCAFPRGREAVEFVLCAARQGSSPTTSSSSRPRCPGVREDLVMVACRECQEREDERRGATPPPVPPKDRRWVPPEPRPRERESRAGTLLRKLSWRG